MIGEVGVYIRRNPDRVRGADLAFWSNAKLPDGPPQVLSKLHRIWS